MKWVVLFLVNDDEYGFVKRWADFETEELAKAFYQKIVSRIDVVEAEWGEFHERFFEVRC